MNDIANNIKQVHGRINLAKKLCQRQDHSVLVLAVSKTKPACDILTAYNAGLRAFGENYLQEALEKIVFFNKNHSDKSFEWHFIGTVQSNKTKLIAENFSWVHTIDRFNIAERLSSARGSLQPKLQVLIQVNISNESSKSGVAIDHVKELAQKIMQLPNLKLRGLMAIAAPSLDYDEQYASFTKLAKLKDSLDPAWQLDSLSMGMSDDMQAAIASGSTIVRVGSAIFGERIYLR